MRIGFDAKRLFNNFTGLGNYSRFMVDALHQAYPKDEYWLYTPKVRNTADTLPFIDHPGFTIKEPSNLIKKMKLTSYWRSVSLGKLAARDGLNIFHGLSNELPTAIPPQLKTVLTVHDLIFKRYPEFYKPLDIFIYDRKMKASCRRANRIVAVSQQTAEDVTRYYGVDPGRISVVYQGCHPNFKKNLDVEQVSIAAAKYRLPEQYILAVGTIEPRKNMLLLLQALVALKSQVPVVIVGKPTHYQKQLNAFIVANRLGDRVRFIHDASFADLPAIYRGASLFVYPSLFEGFGIPIVEAISCGLPVITSKGSCFSEAGGPDCIYVDPHNAEELAHAIDRVLDDTVLQDTMVTGSRRYIQQFEPGVIAAKMHLLYESID